MDNHISLIPKLTSTANKLTAAPKHGKHIAINVNSVTMRDLLITLPRNRNIRDQKP